ncbi:N-acetyltransferase [Thalassobaculum sp. OXR-137]|uniref:GNAT family N-acetyltransferase n=1 Tax=Thalassobaculum sp. OXR-137 TaxID=3100173 RepID=UPI002AC95C5C|nr:N-acetyltransferase [Thalassobaculum sp. OXR-137]WPZ33944.1 N-acetyltransferase [Thalassobaculum sp. OXR-137]
MGVVIRRLTETDWSAFRTIRLRALETAPEVFGTTLDQEAGQPETFWRSRLADPLNAMVCGFDGDVPVAFAAQREGAGGNVRHRATIWGVFVAETHRCQGLGRQLMTALLALADARPGIEITELNVRADNLSAITLYERLGFRAIGTIPRALKHAGRYGDEVMMIREKPGQPPLETPGTAQSPVV